MDSTRDQSNCQIDFQAMNQEEYIRMAKFIHQMVFNVAARGNGSAKTVRDVCSALRYDLDTIIYGIMLDVEKKPKINYPPQQSNQLVQSESLIEPMHLLAEGTTVIVAEELANQQPIKREVVQFKDSLHASEWSPDMSREPQQIRPIHRYQYVLLEPNKKKEINTSDVLRIPVREKRSYLIGQYAVPLTRKEKRSEFQEKNEQQERRRFSQQKKKRK